MIFWKSRAARYKNGRYHEIHGQICGQIPKKKSGYCTVMARPRRKHTKKERWALGGPLWGIQTCRTLWTDMWFAYGYLAEVSWYVVSILWSDLWSGRIEEASFYEESGKIFADWVNLRKWIRREGRGKGIPKHLFMKKEVFSGWRPVKIIQTK